MMSRLTASIRINLSRKQRPGRDVELSSREMPRNENAKQQSGGFCNDRGDRRARDAEIEHQHQQHGPCHVDDVDRDLRR
jgi:hypothetical protein